MVETFFNVLYPLCAVVGFTITGYKLRDLAKDPRNPALAMLCVSRALPAVGFTFATPALYVRVDDIIGVPNLATLVVYGCIALNSATSQCLLLLWNFPREKGWRRARLALAAFAFVVAAMVTLFAQADLASEHPVDFDVHFARTPAVAAFLIVYLGYFGAGLLATALMTSRYAGVVGQPWLRRGLRLTSAGAACALGYFLSKTVSIVARWCGIEALDLVNILVAPIFASVGALCIAAGSTIAAWGPLAAAWVRRYRAYRQLQPLWIALYAATPGIALDPPSSLRLDRWRMGDLEFRLYRRVIEIRDGRMALREHLDPAIGEAARRFGERRGYNGTAVDALAEAAMLASAVRATREGGEPEPVSAAADDSAPGGADLSSELDWLRQVAAFFTSPLLTAALDESAHAPMSDLA